MKRIYCFCLSLLLCLSVFGCQNEENHTEAPSQSPSSEEMSENSSVNSLPPLASDQYEIVSFDGINYIYGVITEKISPNTLAMQVFAYHVETWGEIVHIITDDADEWCVGDEIGATFSVAERPLDSDQYVRIIADDILHPLECAKPIIYLYPEEPTELSVKLTLDGELTCTYPEHGESGWQNFTAYPDGTLIFPDGKEYYALYWEGVQGAEWDFSSGWCVKGENTAAFLEWALAEQGLTPREANEFIIYWLPLMQDNPYNVISFQTDAYISAAVLEISPTPDSLLRVFMTYYPTDAEVDIEPQFFEGFTRQGFTVVEWGGSKVNKP